MFETVENIFVWRHGECIGNVYKNKRAKIENDKMPLTRKGEEEAELAGSKIKEYLIKNKISIDNSILYYSPHLRSVQTKDIMQKDLKIKEEKYYLHLIEQRYGLFDNLPYYLWKIYHPINFIKYKIMLKKQGKFYAKVPEGDSPYDTYLRVYDFCVNIDKEIKDKNIKNIFISAHGSTERLLTMVIMGYEPDWFLKNLNSGFCKIRHIQNKNGMQDRGYIN